MFILKDIFKIGSSSRSNNTSRTENLQLRKQDKNEFVLEESKNKKVHGWLSNDSKNRKRNLNDNANSENRKRDSKKKQYEDFRHIKRDYFNEGSINLRNLEFEDLEGLYCNPDQHVEPVRNNVQSNFSKFDERRGKLFKDNTRKGPLKEKFYDRGNEDTSETSNEDSSVDEEELTGTAETAEDETEMDSDKSFSDFSDDYSSTEGKNNKSKIVHKRKTPHVSYDKNEKKHKFESSAHKRKYGTYYVEKEDQEYCICPPKRMRNLKISNDNFKHKRKSNHCHHKQSTIRTSSTDPRGNPKVPANKRVVVIKQPSSHNRPRRYVENDHLKQKKTQYILIPSGKRKFQRSSLTRIGTNRNSIYQTSSSEISSENDVHKYKSLTKFSSTLLKKDGRKERSKNDIPVGRMKLTQNKKLAENERQSNRDNMSCNHLSKHPQNMTDILYKSQNHYGNSKRTEQERQEKIKGKERNILSHSHSPKKADFVEQSAILEKRNETQSSHVEKRFMKKKRYDRDSKKCLESQQDIFIEKGIGEPNHNKKTAEEKAILQTLVNINKEVPFNENTTTKKIPKEAAVMKGLNELDRGEFQQKKEQSAPSPTTTTTKKKNDGNHRKLDKDKLINRINQLKKPITDTTQSSTELQIMNNKNSLERNEKQRSPTRTKNTILKNINNEICKTKKLKQTSRHDITSDFTTTEKSSMKKSESSEPRQKEQLPYSNNVTATYVLLDTKGNTNTLPFKGNKQDESSWELSGNKRDRNLQLFKLLEEMLGRRKAKRSKPKNIHTVSAVSLRVTKKERTIYKELHKNILKHYRASTSTSGVTFSKTNKPISKNPGIRKNKTRVDAPKKCKKIAQPKLEISILPGIEISSSTMRAMQNEIEDKCSMMEDTENQNSRSENEQKNAERRLRKFRTSRKNKKPESAEDFSLDIKKTSTVNFPPKSQSCTDTHVNNEENPLYQTTGDVSKVKKLSTNSSLLVLNLSDSKDDIESKEWISNKLKSSKSSGENMMKITNDFKTFQRKLFSDIPGTSRNPLLYQSAIKIEVKDIFNPGTAVQSDVTESKAAAPTTPSGDTLLLTFTDSEIWGNNIREEKISTEKEKQEERTDSNEMIEKVENSLQKSIVQDLKNCSRLSVKSTSSSPDSTLNNSETQRCIQEWENLVKRKVLQQLQRKESTYCKNGKDGTVSPISNQYPNRSENYIDNDKKEISEVEYEPNQNILADTIGKKSDIENKNQKNKKRSNLSMSPLETVFEAEEQPTEVIELELLKESSSFTQMRIFKNVENDSGECESSLKEFEDKISKLRNLNDLENVEEEISNFLGDCSLNLNISIDNNEMPLDITSMLQDKNKASSEGDIISEKLMNIYSFNTAKNNKVTSHDNIISRSKTECCTKVFVEPKPEEEKERDEKCEIEKVEIIEGESSSCVPEDAEKNKESNTKAKGNKKIFSRLPVYVKKVKKIKGSLFLNPQQSQKSAESLKITPMNTISNELMDNNQKEEKPTQDEGTNCNLVITKKVDHMINTEVQNKIDQTTNHDTKTKNKQNKSVFCDLQENTKRYHGFLPNRNKVKDVISNCLKKYRLTNSNNKECEDVSKSEKQICSDSSQFTTSSTDSLFVGENSDIDTFHSKTEKECQTTCIQSFTTYAIYADKKQKHEFIPDYSAQSPRTSNDSDFTSKTIESDLFDLSTTTHSTCNDDILQCESEDTPNRLISVLDEKIKKLSEQKDVNSTAAKGDIVLGFMKTQKLPDNDLSFPDQSFSEKENRNATKTNRMPKYHCLTSKGRNSCTKIKPKVTYNLTKESSAFCNLRPNLSIKRTISQKSRVRNPYKPQVTDEMESKNLSSFHRRKHYWDSVRKSDRKCTFAINTKKSKYFLMLSGKEKKKGTGKRRVSSYFEKVLKPSEPSVFFKPLSKSIYQRKQRTKEVKNKDDKTKLNRYVYTKINPNKFPQNYAPQYENPIVGCSRCVRVRHSSSLISVTDETERNDQKIPSTTDIKRHFFKERLPTFYSYNFCNEETNIDNKTINNNQSSDSIVDGDEKRTKNQYDDNFKLKEKKSVQCMDSNIKTQSYLHSHDLDFVQNYNISELCNGNMDRTLEKQFVDKVRKRAKELFKNFMDELNADSLAANKSEKDRFCQRHVDLESLAGEIYYDNEDLSTEKSFIQKTKPSQDEESETTDQGDYFKSKSRGSTFTDYIVEERGTRYKEEPLEIISANTSGDTNATSFDEYENIFSEYPRESKYKLNYKIDKFSPKLITLARAEIEPYHNYIPQSASVDYIQRFNNDGDVIQDSNVDNKIEKEQKNSIEKKFEVGSFDGDLYNSESDINFTLCDDATSKVSSKSLNSKKILSTIDSISYVDDQNVMCNLKTLTEKILKDTLAQKFEDNSTVMEEQTSYIDGRAAVAPVTSKSNLVNFTNQSSHLKICESFYSFNGEAFKPSESSYFSSDSETVKQQHENEKYSDNCSEENCSQTDLSALSISQADGPCLIIHDCIISDEDKFLQDFTETSSISSRKQEESDSKSNVSATFSDPAPHNYTSGTVLETKIIDMDNNNVTNAANDSKDSRYFNLLSTFDFDTNNLTRKEKDENAEIEWGHSKTFFTINENIINSCFDDFQPLPSSGNQDHRPNFKSDETTNATKIYESPVDPLFSSVRVYHEKIVKDSTEQLLQNDCSTFHKENSTNTILNINKQNNRNDETVLDEFAMTLTSYESSPNVCASQNQNQDFCVNTNSGTSKLTPEEMDSGFESTKYKTNAQRLLIKTVSTSDLQDFNTSVNSIRESRSSHSMFASVSSCSVTKNFFHNVRRKTSRKKKDSLTALSRAVQLQSRSSIHLNQSFHWKEFWKNVGQISDSPSKQIIKHDISNGDVGKCNEDKEKHLFFDSIKHLKDFHFENTYLSYSLFELNNDPGAKWFPVGNRNFLTYNVYVYNGKEVEDKATQTKHGVYFIPYVSITSIPTCSSLNLPQQRNFKPNTAKNNSQLPSSSSRYEKRKPAHTNLKKVSERNDPYYSDLKEIHNERRPYRKKKTKRTEENVASYDTNSVDDSGCGTVSSEKSYETPKRLNREMFQGHKATPYKDFRDILASIEECRSQYLVDNNWAESRLETNQSPYCNTEEGPLSTSENEGRNNTSIIRENKGRTINDPSSSSSTLNRYSVNSNKRKVRKRNNKNQEKNYFNRDYSSDGDEEDILESNDPEDQNPRCNLPKQENIMPEHCMRLQRPLLTFVKNMDNASQLKQKNRNDDNLTGAKPKDQYNRITNMSGISGNEQPLNIIPGKATKQQLKAGLNEGLPTVVLQNEAQPCNCLKRMMEIGNPQTPDEITRVKKIYEAVGCSCSSKKNIEEVEDQIQIEQELGHDTNNLVLDDTDHLQRPTELEVIDEEEPSNSEKQTILPNTSGTKNEIVLENDIPLCNCMKKMIEIINPQTPEEVQKIHKLYEVVGCSCDSKKVIDGVAKGDRQNEDKLRRDIEDKEAKRVLDGSKNVTNKAAKRQKRTEDELCSDIENSDAKLVPDSSKDVTYKPTKRNKRTEDELGRDIENSDAKLVPDDSEDVTDELARRQKRTEDELGRDIQNMDAKLVLSGSKNVTNKAAKRQKRSEDELGSDIENSDAKLVPDDSEDVTDELVRRQKRTEAELDHGIEKTDAPVLKNIAHNTENMIQLDNGLRNKPLNIQGEPILKETSEPYLQRSPESQIIDEDSPKLVKRATLHANTEELTTMVVNYEETLEKKGRNKETSHCLLSESELLKQQKIKEHEVRNSLTDKEIFEKLLANYEKDDKLIREISQNDDIIELQATVEDGQHSSMNFEQTAPSYSEMDESTTKVSEEPKTKKLKKEKPHQRRKQTSTDKSSIDVLQKDSESLKMDESQTFDDNTPQRRTRFFGKKKSDGKKISADKTKSNQMLMDMGSDKEKETSKSKKTKISDGISYSSNEDSLKVKKGDTKTVTEQDIIKSKELGKCFRRGFTPDSTTLSGEPCLSLSPEEEAFRLNTLQRKPSLIEFSERGSPLDYLLSLGFSIDEASNAIKDDDVKHRLYAAITEARIWVNHINANQGTLLYLAAYKTKPNIMRYFLQLIEAIINGRINDAVKLDAFIKLLEKVENGDISIVKILGFDQFEDEINEEVILRKQLRQLFVTIFKIAGKEAEMKGRELDKDTIELLRILAARYRAGLHPHLELIARYIGQGLLVDEIQLEAAMIYLSRLDTADVNLSQFEKYCSITCGKNANKTN